MKPQKIGRYRVNGLLGQGAMGVVYSARDDQMGRDVAVKMMTTRLESDQAARARFFREAQLTSKLLHRNVVTVLDLGEVDGHPFIVMELLKGSTLTTALHEPRLNGIEVKLDLMIQTCEGLARAHAAGIVHRDIKPNNLYVLPDGSLKILDFGVARLADSSITRSGLVIGTPDYMSPEQARGDEADARSDVFSAAAVFYFMVTGRKPFEALDVPSILRKVINEDAPPILEAEVPAALPRIILRALRKNADTRYQSCVDMAADLTRVKRHFDAETRQLGVAVQAQFDRLLQLADGVARVRTQLAVAPATMVGEQTARLRQRFPFLCSRSHDSTPLPMPFRRDRLTAIAEELRAVRQGFMDDLEKIAIDATALELRRTEPDVPGRAPVDPVLMRDATVERMLAGSRETPHLAGGLSALLRKARGPFGRWISR